MITISSMTEIERWYVNNDWDVVKYNLDPPQPRMQSNLNKLLGPQTSVFQIERRGDNVKPCKSWKNRYNE